ncbi:MAG: dTDP-4-dehydrorhamnose 3,5-epimerase family protein [Chloroflexi bacterium]|nr:dTDP-4-dehydrorhamnose 3,5-epimerase family protein [Chloroflexota bacterium]
MLPLVQDGRATICDVVVRRLKVNRDARGILVEALRTDWPDVFQAGRRPFTQCYYSVTYPGIARDEDRWHAHQHQDDRFVVAQGDIVLALYDGRQDSPTKGQLNLLHLGTNAGDEQQHQVLVPPGVLHAYLVIGAHPAILLNFPTRLYDSSDEGRIPFAQSGVLLPDGRPFSWDALRREQETILGRPT